MGNKKYLGKRMTWSEMARTFPDKHVGVSDYRADQNTFSGVIECVCDSMFERNKASEELNKQGKEIYWNYMGIVEMWGLACSI